MVAIVDSSVEAWSPEQFWQMFAFGTDGCSRSWGISFKTIYFPWLPLMFQHFFDFHVFFEHYSILFKSLTFGGKSPANNRTMLQVAAHAVGLRALLRGGHRLRCDGQSGPRKPAYYDILNYNMI